MQGIKPLLYFERLDVLRDLIAPLGNQEIADVVVENGFVFSDFGLAVTSGSNSTLR
jgi:hypothetical protein